MSAEAGPCVREAVYLQVTVGSPRKICCELTDEFISRTMSSAKSIGAEAILKKPIIVSLVFMFYCL